MAARHEALTSRRRKILAGVAAVARAASGSLLGPGAEAPPPLSLAPAPSHDSRPAPIRTELPVAGRSAVADAPAPSRPRATRHELRGAVVDAASGEPVTGFRVFWQRAGLGDIRAAAQSDPAVGLQRHDIAGRFRVSELEAGVYSLLIDPSDTERLAAVVDGVAVPRPDPVTVEVGRLVGLRRETSLHVEPAADRGAATAAMEKPR